MNFWKMGFTNVIFVKKLKILFLWKIENEIFVKKVILKMKLLLKMGFWKSEFFKKRNFENLIFLLNMHGLWKCEFCEKETILKWYFCLKLTFEMWFLWKMWFWKWDFCKKKCETLNEVFAENGFLKTWFLWNIWLWTC